MLPKRDGLLEYKHKSIAVMVSNSLNDLTPLDVIWMFSNIANIHADDETIYTCDMRLENVIFMLENDSKIIIECFGNNYMKLNEDKCHFMIFGERTNQDISIDIGNCTVDNSEEEKLLGVLIDSNFDFEKHVSNICKKTGNKLFALSRMSTYLGTDKLRLDESIGGSRGTPPEKIL